MSGAAPHGAGTFDPGAARRTAGSAEAARARGASGLFLAVAALAFASRLPFLFAGYGSDPDAWRIATTARAIALSHHYAASRLPGFPVQEILSALLWRGGPLLLNGVGALLSALGIGAFALTLRRLGARDAALGALALAATPVVFIAGVSALDYAWAMGLMLVALDQALRGRAVRAGVLLGLAAGCRLTSLAAAIPLAILLAGAGAGARGRLLRFALALLLTAGVALAPAALTYGAGMLHVYEHGYPRPLYVAKNASVDVWGIPGTLALVAAALAWTLGARPPRRAASAPEVPGRRVTLAAWSGIALFGAAFLRLPHEAGYLIPAIPFVLLLLATRVSRAVFVTTCVALLISPWCFKVSEIGKPDTPPPSALSIGIPPGNPRLVLDVLHGPVITDRLRRVRAMRFVDDVIARAARLPGNSVIAAYEWLPLVRVRLGGDVTGGTRFVYVPGPAEMAHYAAAGVRVYLMPGAEDESRRVNGASLLALGAAPTVP